MLEKYKKQIDGITFVMAIVVPMVTLPQLFKIWVEQNEPTGAIFSFLLPFADGVDT